MVSTPSSSTSSPSPAPWLWDDGDYAVTARDLHRLSVEAVRRAGPQSGQPVLDLGTGTGNAALLAARTGARVTGVDLADRLLEEARGRAADAGLAIDFVHGDLHALPFADGSFDVALSVSAAVLVPGARQTAHELVRVLRPGGHAVVVGWHEDSILGRLSTHFPVVSPELIAEDPGWYSPDRVERLFAPHPVTVAVEEIPFGFEAAGEDELVARMTGTHPVLVDARARLDDDAWDAVADGLRATIHEHARPTDDGGVRLPARCLVVEILKDA
ncbi:class I SAM-dependent methyltransferase [Patulibacter sp.]|uniref:class I SAM-dependent methyltransferase n=1 Tax=Patulibacter sp. TaxID=1912859 RepID=UPI00271AE8F8|nr:class I SAM-dependent methyltransferase [Patulibacter sp.]MDO9409759.1 methyltransferase domain-containing protein [Patulibacter sp.]